jgi:hypothetical protein
MTQRLLFAAMLLAVAASGTAAAQPPPNPDPARFEKDIAAFEAQDRTSPPAPGAVLFVGSSSTTNWNVAAAFPGMPLVKRGYGGSHVSDTIHFALRIIWPYKPSLIVFYAGDADVAAGKGAERIAGDTAALLRLIHETLPGTPVVVIGTKPSPLHWKHIETIRKANALIGATIARDGRDQFVDVEPALLGADGQPRPDLYAQNGLNLNAAGYEAWTAAVRPVVLQAAKR